MKILNTAPNRQPKGSSLFIDLHPLWWPFYLDMTIQPTTHPTNSASIKSVFFYFREKEVVAHHVPKALQHSIKFAAVALPLPTDAATPSWMTTKPLLPFFGWIWMKAVSCCKKARITPRVMLAIVWFPTFCSHDASMQALFWFYTELLNALKERCFYDMNRKSKAHSFSANGP